MSKWLFTTAFYFCSLLVVFPFCTPVSALSQKDIGNKRAESSLDEFLSIESDFLDYDGESLSLEGHVFLEHEWGKIVTDYAVLLRDAVLSKAAPYRTFKLMNNVSLEMRGGGSLHCADAELDIQSLTGKFLGGGPEHAVAYFDSVLDAAGGRVPVQMESAQMHLDLKVQDKILDMDHVHAEGDVRLYYGALYAAFADEALFVKEKAPTFSGSVVLTPKGKMGRCCVEYTGGDCIHASRIFLSGGREELLCRNARGKVLSFPGHEVDISAGSLLWKEKDCSLTLKEHVLFDDKVGVEIEVEDELSVLWEPSQTGRYIRELQSTGETYLTMGRENQDHWHSLFCSGGIHINHLAMKALLFSVFENGSVLEGKQVVFQDKMGQVRGDTVVLEYEMREGRPQLLKMLITGNVRMLNQVLDPKGLTSDHVRYALADEAEICFKTMEMQLRSKEGGHVLYADKERNVQMSAQTIKAYREPSSGLEFIEGIGTVRCLFDEKELECLKQAFHWSS